MYDAEDVDIKFSRLRRNLKGKLWRENKLISVIRQAVLELWSFKVG